jgi:hypothetical protein
MKRLGLVLIFLAVTVGPAHAASMIFRSSAAIDTGGIDQVNALGNGLNDEIIGVGNTGTDVMVVRYSSALVFIASATFDAGATETGEGVAIDGSGNVYVVGSAASAFLIIKYSQNLTFVSSRTFAAGTNDVARGAVVDGSGNLFVTGQAFIAGNDMLTAKFDSNLGLLASRVFNAGGQDFGFAITAAPTGEIFITGQSLLTTHFDFLTVKYPNTLATETTQHRFDLTSQQDQARAIAVRGSSVVVTGQTTFDTSDFDILTVSYDFSLANPASAVYDNGLQDQGEGVAIDEDGTVVIAGRTQIAAQLDVLVLRLSPALALVSSATFGGGNTDQASGLVLDSLGNIFAGGDAQPAANADFLLLRYNGAPRISTAPAAQQDGNFQLINVVGGNFAVNSVITISTPGVTINGSAPVTDGILGVSVNVSSLTPLGQYDLTITNSDGVSTTSVGGFSVEFSSVVESAVADQITTVLDTGLIAIRIPAAAFAADFTATVSKPSTAPSPGTLIPTGVRFEVLKTLDIQPTINVSIDVEYRDADLNGVAEADLFLAYYDTATLTWTQLAGAVDAGNNRVTAATDHFTVFQLMGPAVPGGGGGPAPSTGTAGGDIYVFPNPYKPGESGAFGDPREGAGVVFANMPARFKLRIYNVTGRLVFERESSSIGGKFLWDTVSRTGSGVASGVYVYTVHDGAGGLMRRSKFAVIR